MTRSGKILIPLLIVLVVVMVGYTTAFRIATAPSQPSDNKFSSARAKVERLAQKGDSKGCLSIPEGYKRVECLVGAAQSKDEAPQVSYCRQSSETLSEYSSERSYYFPPGDYARGGDVGYGDYCALTFVRTFELENCPQFDGERAKTMCSNMVEWYPTPTSTPELNEDGEPVVNNE